MAKRNKENKKPIEQYDHKGYKRLNNPPVGLVTPDTDKDTGQKQTYQYDPHLDPSLQWAGKAERLSFEVPTVSLHVHERIDPSTIIEGVRKKNGSGAKQMFFAFPEENPPLRDAIEFYKHSHNWSNRLIAGDSLLVMNSLIEKEGMAGKVQMVYIDPPYGIKYGSNFQPFVNNRDVKDGKDEDLTSEPEMIKAFRDTWELGIHSYLTYLRDRLLLARELLNESGSCFVQISDENIHLVRNLLDEIFGAENFIVNLIFTKTGSKESGSIDPINDYIIWYAKNRTQLKFRKLFIDRRYDDLVPEGFKYLNENDEIINEIPKDFLPDRVVRADPILSDGYRETTTIEVSFDENKYYPGIKNHWKTSVDGMNKLNQSGRLIKNKRTLQYLRKLSDYPVKGLSNIWSDLGGASNMKYVVQTTETAIQRCILMTTDPGDLVFDPTCGSGTTGYVAEQWGRRWITCDTSRIAVTLAKQRLMAGLFNYYQLAQPNEGVGSGFKYKTVPHITLKSIANNEPPGEETLYDQPLTDNSKARVTGPFTVEAVPAQAVKSLDDIEERPANDLSVTRSGETLRQSQWRDELFKTGIRGKGGQRIEFSRVEPFGGTRWLQCDAETKEDKPQRVVVSFGPEYAPFEQRQVELAIQEAQTLVPKPKIVVFSAFEFDPEAAKDIDELNWPGVNLIKVKMNADLLTDDLKKKRSSNESFWLIGQPDVAVRLLQKGEYKGKLQVEIMGFDYYNTRSGNIESGGTEKIAMWMLDTDYDERSLFPKQVFFPMAGEKDGWARLAKTLKAEIDEELIESYKGTVSLPFEVGENKRIAVKIVDDRGIESLKIIQVKG